MKRQRVLILTSAWCITAMAPSAEPKSAASPSSGDARQQVLDLGKEWVAAEVKHDVVTVGRILDDKFLASVGSRPPYNKATYIKKITDGEVDPTESQTLTDESVIVDRDTAVVVGTDNKKLRLRISPDGHASRDLPGIKRLRTSHAGIKQS